MRCTDPRGIHSTLGPGCLVAEIFCSRAHGICIDIQAFIFTVFVTATFRSCYAMVSATFPSFALLLLQVFPFIQLVSGATTYWVDPVCSTQGDLADSITEAIWNAGRLAASLEQRDSRWEEALKWFFGFDYSTMNVLGLPKVDNVQCM